MLLQITEQDLTRLVKRAYIDGFEDGVGVGRHHPEFSLSDNAVEPHWDDSVTEHDLRDRVKRLRDKRPMFDHWEQG